MPYSISVFAVIFNPFFLTGIYRLKIAKQDCVDEKKEGNCHSPLVQSIARYLSWQEKHRLLLVSSTHRNFIPVFFVLWTS